MKGKLISIGIGVVETGGGWVISYFSPNLLWLGYALIGIGIITIILGIIWKYVVKCSKWLKSKIVLFCRVITRIPESGKLLSFKDEQQKNPYKWLHPVTKWINLDREGLPENTIILSFGIDSSLLENYKPEEVWVKVEFEYGAYQYMSKWYQVNNKDIKAGCRESWESISIDVSEDEDMIKGIKEYKKECQLRRTVKVKLLKPNGEDVLLEPIYSIDPQ